MRKRPTLRTTIDNETRERLDAMSAASGLSVGRLIDYLTRVAVEPNEDVRSALLRGLDAITRP